MGWSDGQGLGVKKQGITEHIKVRVKQDSKGEFSLLRLLAQQVYN